MLLSQVDYLYKIDLFKISLTFTFHILPYLKMQKLTAGDLIYRREDSSEEVFFLFQGDVCLLD